MELVDNFVELLHDFFDEWSIVTEFFEDMEDDRRPYQLGSVYPAAGAPAPTAERVRALSSGNNPRHRPLIVKLREDVTREVAEKIAVLVVSQPNGQVSDMDKIANHVLGKVTEAIADTQPDGQAAGQEVASEAGAVDAAEDAPEEGPPGEEKPPDDKAKPAGKAASRKKNAEAGKGGLAPAT